MTPEEAVEEVLKGPYTECWYCKGSGEINHEPYKNLFTADLCTHCHGRGQWVRGDYNRACIITGRPTVELIPAVKPDAFSMSATFWPRQLSGEEVVQLYNHENKKLMQQQKFVREYVGVWSSSEPNVQNIPSKRLAAYAESDCIKTQELMKEL